MQKDQQPPIELGIVTAGAFEQIDRQAIEDAIESVVTSLQNWLPDFDWQMPLIRREELVEEPLVEPVELLFHALEQRDAGRWDFAIILTAADLVAHYKPYTYAVVSRSLDLAAISTARIDPKALDEGIEGNSRLDRLQARIGYLILHSLGHWSGLKHSTDSDNVMFDCEEASEFAAAIHFTDPQISKMKSALSEIADQRLEDTLDKRRESLASFSAKAIFRNIREISTAVVHARPWEFPFRLSRFATAAVSTVLLLMIGAETWDLAMSQSITSVVCLFCLTLALTTGYVTARQQLLVRKVHRSISEQIVATNVSAILIVVVGICTMYCVLFALSLSASLLLFPYSVIAGWAPSQNGSISLFQYLLLSGVVSSLGILIGALGASFEEQHYFRHVIFVDEEI